MSFFFLQFSRRMLVSQVSHFASFPFAVCALFLTKTEKTVQPRPAHVSAYPVSAAPWQLVVAFRVPGFSKHLAAFDSLKEE